MSLYTGTVSRASVIGDMEKILADLQAVHNTNNYRLVEMLMVACDDVEKQMMDRHLIKHRLSENGHMSTPNHEFQRSAMNHELLSSNIPTVIRRLMHWWNPNIVIKHDPSMPSVEELWNGEISDEQDKSVELIDWIRTRKTFQTNYGRRFGWICERQIVEQIDMRLLRMISECERHMAGVRKYLYEFNAVDFSDMEFNQAFPQQIQKIKSFIKENK